MKKTNVGSTWNNIVFSIKDCYRCSPLYTILLPTSIVLNLFLNFLGLFQMRYVIDMIYLKSHWKNVIIFLFGISIIFLTVRIINSIIGSIITYEGRKQWYKMRYRGVTKIRSIDYDDLIEPEMKTKSTQFINDSSSKTINVYSCFLNLINGIMTAIVYGTLVSVLHPVIIIILIVLSFFYYFAKKPLAKLQKELELRGEANNRKFSYVTRIACDLQNAKEIRLFNMADWIDEITNDCIREHKTVQSKLQDKTFRTGIIHLVLMFFRDGLAYIFLINAAANSGVSLGEFTIIFTSITAFSTTINGFSDLIYEINKSSLLLDSMKSMINYKSRFNNSNKQDPPQIAPKIDFINVSYKYSNSNTYALKNVSFSISPYERIAIVGENGAGKSTLIKIMMGLLTATSGEVKINDIPINQFDNNEYYNLFSVVFQDVDFLPISISEIVSTEKGKSIDRKKVKESLYCADLLEKVESLSNGIDTCFGKEYNSNGIYLSGGEKQKLALARAIYLNRPILVLDEPTAYFDPISEQKMFTNYQSISSNATSILISHRLASTKCCDQIMVVKEGEMIAFGTHNELMSSNEYYKHMFNTQAKKYI